MAAESPRALLPRSPGSLPWLGHTRLVLPRQSARLDLALRVGGAPQPEIAWALVCSVHQALQGVDGADRLALCRDAWERLCALSGDGLQDVSVLMVCSDPGGDAVSAVGLSALWGQGEEGVAQLVPAQHPLLTATGLPERPPRVLGPPNRWLRYLGVPHGAPDLTPTDGLMQQLLRGPE